MSGQTSVDIVKSDWLRAQVELLRSIRGFKKKGIDAACKAQEDLAEEEYEQRFLRVFYSSDARDFKASIRSIAETSKKYEAERYDKTTIVAERFTKSPERG